MVRLAACATVRCSPRQLMRFVEFHLCHGFERIFLYFDDPNDVMISTLRSNDRVECVVCDDQYWLDNAGSKRSFLSLNTIQNINSKLALIKARQYKFDWLVHIDSDEIVYDKNGILETLASIPQSVHVVRLRTYEFIPSDSLCASMGLSGSFFKVGPMPMPFYRRFLPVMIERLCFSVMRYSYAARIVIAKMLGCHAPFFLRYIKGHIAGKSIVRVSAPVEGLDCHVPVPLLNAQLITTYCRSSLLLHFDTQDYDEWFKKWVMRTSGPSSYGAEYEMGEHRLSQRGLFMQCEAAQDGISYVDLYRKLYHFDENDFKLLIFLGLIIRLSDTELSASDMYCDD